MKTDDVSHRQSDWICEASDLSLDDQKWIWKNLSFTEEENLPRKNVYVNGSVNATCKNEGKSRQKYDKNVAITQLRNCGYRTAPPRIADLLLRVFPNPSTKDGWWLYVAQKWHPKAINSVVRRIFTQIHRGDVSVQNPAAYFSYLIKFKKKRKIFR